MLGDVKQTFPPIVWIFTEGDGIESRNPFKVFSSLMIKSPHPPRLFHPPRLLDR